MNFETCRYVLGIDPSGSFLEGRGTTGYCVYDKKNNKVIKTGVICAKDYNKDVEYWGAHLELIDGYVNHYKNIIVSMEDYRLYSSKVNTQINSTCETIQLIGIIKMYCFENDILLSMRMAVTAKTRFPDEILVHKGIIKKDKSHYFLRKSKNCKPLLEHERDSIRHAVYCAYFDKEENCLWKRLTKR